MDAGRLLPMDVYTEPLSQKAQRQLRLEEFLFRVRFRYLGLYLG